MYADTYVYTCMNIHTLIYIYIYTYVDMKVYEPGAYTYHGTERKVQLPAALRTMSASRGPEDHAKIRIPI